MFVREAVTSLSEAGEQGETGLEQVVSLCGEQAASVEDIYSAVTPSEVRRIKEANPEIMSKLCFKVRRANRIIVLETNLILIFASWWRGWGTLWTAAVVAPQTSRVSSTSRGSSPG